MLTLSSLMNGLSHTDGGKQQVLKYSFYSKHGNERLKISSRWCLFQEIQTSIHPSSAAQVGPNDHADDLCTTTLMFSVLLPSLLCSGLSETPLV